MGSPMNSLEVSALDDDPNPDDGYTANEPSELIEPFEHLPFEPDAILVPIVRRAGYRLDGRANQSQSVVLADGVDTAWWSSAALVVIIHAKSGLSSTADIRVELHDTVLDPDAPGVSFVTGPEPLATSAAIESTSPAPIVDVDRKSVV